MFQIGDDVECAGRCMRGNGVSACRYVISLPDVRREGMESGEEYVVLASDGLWDVVSNKACR